MPKKNLKLDSSAFATAPAPERRAFPRALVDSHVQLWHFNSSVPFGKTEVIPGADILLGDHSLQVFSDLVGAAHVRDLDRTRSDGFIYVASVTPENLTDVGGASWDAALCEVLEICQAALTVPSPKLLSIVPWAPIHLGADAMALYFYKLATIEPLQAIGGPDKLIRSVRFNLDNVPEGFLLQETLIEGLRWLGERDIAFDVSVNVALKGASVLNELLECISQVHADQAPEHQTRFILDHFSRPPMHSSSSARVSPEDNDYIARMQELSLVNNVYLKLSGLLSNANPDLVQAAFHEYYTTREYLKPERTVPLSTIASALYKAPGEKQFDVLKRRVVVFLEPILQAFGDSKIVVGSEWPMFRLPVLGKKGPENSASVNHRFEGIVYNFQLALYLQSLADLGLDGEAIDRIFFENARSCYKLEYMVDP